MRNVSEILFRERKAWQAYVDYMTSKMPNYGREHHQTTQVDGDDESRRLFGIWRQIRDELDGVSQPEHKANRMHAGRFSTRGRT